MNNEYNEYDTFEMEINGEVMELAIEEEFEVEEQKYVVASKIEGDTINEEASYIFRCVEVEDGVSIEKIADADEYARVTESFMNQ